MKLNNRSIAGVVLLIALSASAAYAQQQFTHTVTKLNKSCNTTCTVLDVPELNNNPAAIILVTPILANGMNLNPHPIGAYFMYLKKWSILNLDQTSIVEGAKFNVQYFVNPGPDRFVYIVPERGSPCIDHAGLNDNPNAQIRLFPTGSPTHGALYNKEDIKVEYDAAVLKWCIANINNKPVPSDVAYNIVLSSGGSANTNPQIPKTLGEPATTRPPAENPKGSAPNPRPASAPAYQSGDPKQESERINRLSEIARLLQDPKEDTVALLTEAARLCGFAIWTEDRAKIADPSGAPRLKLAVTDAEIREYAEMFRTGDSVVLNDLIAMVDVVYKGIGSEPSCGPMIMEWLQNGGRSENPSVRALTSFLQSLSAYRGGGSASLFETGNESLDPIQSLLILRVVTEEIGGALRKALAKEKPPPRSASFNHAQQAGEAPGWAEDAFAGGITGLWDHLTPGTGLEAYGEKVGKANAILSIVKFIATYIFLKGDVRVEAPGQPLIRTMDFHAGEVRKVVARFWIDGMKVTDWMKDHRVLVAFAGLDLDMPKSGALKGVPTDWAVDQSNLVAHQLIQTTRGTGALHNRMTDEKGEASVEWEGFPQPVVLDPKKVMPMPKQARITVIPSVKEIGMQQDLVDAVTGAIGIRGGPVGFITPLMEMLYRLKWTGSASLVLQVRDWNQADTIGQLSISMRESWSRIRYTTAERHTIDRSLVYTDVGMQVIGGEPPPAIDPRVFTHASPEERKQMEAGLKQMAEMAKKRQFYGTGPGAMHYSINDVRWKRGPDDECDSTDETTRATTWIGSDTRDYAPTDKFQVSVDLEKKIVTVSADSLLKVKFVEITKTGKITGRQDKDDVKSIFFGLKLLPPFDRDKPIEIPLKETKVIDSDATNYYGAVTIPFTYGAVTEYKGNIILSYSVTRKVVKPK
jgi:hypothetical protein